MCSNNNGSDKVSSELSAEERTVIKYNFIRDKIIFHFKRGCRILNISKIIAAVLFVLFTVIGVIVSSRTGNKLSFLQAWILVIFLNIIIFVIADYAKYLVGSKVIPYLEDDSRTEFGEYDIFLEDIDNEEEED